MLGLGLMISMLDQRRGAAAAPAPPARNLFAVGTGSRNWSDPAIWSLTSGGAGGQPPPDVSSSVTLDGNSGTGTITVDTNISVTAITSGAFAGTINATGRTITTGSWSGTGTATRTVNLTNATVNVTGIGSCWTWTTVTGLTFTVTGSTINISGSGARTLNFGATTYGTVNVTGLGTVTSGNQNATFGNLSVSKNGTMIVGNFTIAGTFFAVGPSQTDRLLLGSSATGTQRTLTAADVTLANVDIYNITGAGAGVWAGSSVGNAGGNSNITFTPAVTRYLVNAGGKTYSDVTVWSASPGGATGATMPLPQDTAVADASSFSAPGQTFTVDIPRIGAQDWSAVTNAPNLAVTGAYSMYGSIDVPTGTGAVVPVGNFIGTIAVQTGTMNLNLHLPAISAVGGQTVLTGGFLGSVTIQSPGGTVSLGSHFLTEGVFTLNAGTLVTNNFDMQATHFASAGTATRVLTLGSSRLLSSSNSGTGQAIFNFTSTGITVTANTARLETFSGSSSVRIANLAGLTFGSWLDWYHDNLFNSAPVQFNGGATFTGAFTVDPSTFVRSYTFQTGLTVTVGSLSLAGSSTSSRLTVQSSTASPFTFSDAAGTNTCSFCTIINSTALGGATFNAGNSIDGGGNTGWNFS